MTDQSGGKTSGRSSDLSARLQAVAEKLLDDTFVGRMIACASDRELYELVNA